MAIPITYRDVATYKNLTNLKAEAVTLVEAFDAKPVAQNEVRSPARKRAAHV